MPKEINKEWVLGLSYGHHESSCSILSNKGDLFFLREEWLTRVKLDYRFPKSSINYFLNNIIKDDKISAVCHFQNPLKNWLSIGTKKNLSPENYQLKIRQFRKSDIFIEKDLKKIIKNKYDLLYCPHHLSHALAAKSFAKKNKRSIYLVLDGYGDGSSGAAFNEDFVQFLNFSPNQSLGIVYSAITEWAGFIPNEDEYKVMAIAAFGKPIYKDFILKNIIRFQNGSIFINEKYFNFIDIAESPIKSAFYKKFSRPQSRHGENVLNDKTLCDVICSFQESIEVVVSDLIHYIVSSNKNIEQIICSGGLFHNSVLVGKISKKFNQEIIIPPCPGDAGSSIGAAFFASIYKNWRLNKFNDKNKTLSPFVGTNAPVLNSYDNLFNVKTKTYQSSLKFAKKLLNEDEVFAVFDGRFEIGPRALGSRSLICNATSRLAVKKLNEIIKKREAFRPLAIMVNKSNFKKIFEADKHDNLNLLWMGQVNWTAKHKKYAFLHKDNSSRPQIVLDGDNFIDGGRPSNLLNSLLNNNILANTSFNIAGDPMVFDIEDVYINMVRMGLKYIFNNNKFYEIKNENSL